MILVTRADTYLASVLTSKLDKRSWLQFTPIGSKIDYNAESAFLIFFRVRYLLNYCFDTEVGR